MTKFKVNDLVFIKGNGRAGKILSTSNTGYFLVKFFDSNMPEWTAGWMLDKEIYSYFLNFIVFIGDAITSFMKLGVLKAMTISLIIMALTTLVLTLIF